jgi:flagellin-like hook-associated protein FlgL
MGQDTANILKILNRLNNNLDTQRNRSGLMQRWLDEHTERLNNLSAQIDAHLTRINALRGQFR